MTIIFSKDGSRRMTVEHPPGGQDLESQGFPQQKEKEMDETRIEHATSDMQRLLSLHSLGTGQLKHSIK